MFFLLFPLKSIFNTLCSHLKILFGKKWNYFDGILLPLNYWIKLFSSCILLSIVCCDLYSIYTLYSIVTSTKYFLLLFFLCFNQGLKYRFSLSLTFYSIQADLTPLSMVFFCVKVSILLFMRQNFIFLISQPTISFVIYYILCYCFIDSII